LHLQQTVVIALAAIDFVQIAQHTRNDLAGFSSLQMKRQNVIRDGI
jgi:hypothetical protein